MILTYSLKNQWTREVKIDDDISDVKLIKKKWSNFSTHSVARLFERTVSI